MLRTQVSPPRLAAGIAVVGGFSVAALGLTASGTSAAERIRTQVADATGIPLPPPVPPVPPVPAVAHAAPAGKQVHRVVIVKDGRTTTYEGEEAQRYIAEHPAPTPPEPPVAPDAPEPPAPPAPPAVAVTDGGLVRVDVQVPLVTSVRCGGEGEVVRRSVRRGREQITICTDRIERQAHQAQVQAQAAVADAGRIRLFAMRQALEGLRAAKASMAVNRALPEDAREDAAQSIQESIKELQEQMDRPDC